MLLYKLLKKFGHFQLRKALVKNPTFGVKMQIKRFQSIFAYTCKEVGGGFSLWFSSHKNPRKKYRKKIWDLRDSFDQV